jgi:hypothetical protein
MATIQVDEQTAAAISAKAAAQGVSVAELLRRWVGGNQTEPKPRLTDQEFERMFEELSIHTTPLPPDFSRADIYLDHD